MVCLSRWAHTTNMLGDCGVHSDPVYRLKVAPLAELCTSLHESLCCSVDACRRKRSCLFDLRSGRVGLRSKPGLEGGAFAGAHLRYFISSYPASLRGAVSKKRSGRAGSSQLVIRKPNRPFQLCETKIRSNLWICAHTTLVHHGYAPVRLGALVAWCWLDRLMCWAPRAGV